MKVATIATKDLLSLKSMIATNMWLEILSNEFQIKVLLFIVSVVEISAVSKVKSTVFIYSFMRLSKKLMLCRIINGFSTECRHKLKLTSIFFNINGKYSGTK